MVSKLAIIISLNLFVLSCYSQSNQCNTGTISCCDSVKSINDPYVEEIAKSLEINTKLSGNVGLYCKPLSVIGLGGNSCSSQPACCTGKDINGIITLGCSPININL